MYKELIKINVRCLSKWANGFSKETQMVDKYMKKTLNKVLSQHGDITHYYMENPSYPSENDYHKKKNQQIQMLTGTSAGIQAGKLTGMLTEMQAGMLIGM